MITWRTFLINPQRKGFFGNGYGTRFTRGSQARTLILYIRHELESLRLRKFVARCLNLAAHLRTIPGAGRIADSPSAVIPSLRAGTIQISRCGPSIRLNYAESQAASSRTHFITIIETAFRVARETQAALETIIDAEFVKPSRLVDKNQESCEIVAILTTIAKNAKENQPKAKQQKKRRS